MIHTSSLVQPSPGFGLGLRTPHYPELLAALQGDASAGSASSVDWLEIITDNFLVQGGKPLYHLDQFAARYPLAMHGVAMSLGQVGGLDPAYLKRVKQLADRIQPLWISDHLCWTGDAQAHLHDLNPLPYTQEAADVVIRNLRQAQDVLGRRLVVENVSSYVTFQYSAREEWEFLSYVLQEADSLLLLDVNNVYVSSRNHGFAAMDYIQGLPKQRIQQIHLAGHSDNGTHIIDTHDHPVSQGVWDLYAQVCASLGPVATMIERDDNIPPLSELLLELKTAKSIAAKFVPDAANTQNTPKPVLQCTPSVKTHTTNATSTLTAPKLTDLQANWVHYILDTPQHFSADSAMTGHIAAPQAHITTDTAQQRLGIYHHAYRARLCEVLADSFEKTVLYMGETLFHEQVSAFAVAQPPSVNSLNQYGAELPAWFHSQYPENPELTELAQLEWDLRACFDGEDVTALSAENAALDTAQSWLTVPASLHPSLQLRPITRNIVAIWRAIDADADVPQVTALDDPLWLAVWRKGMQPHFKTVDVREHALLTQLLQGASIVGAVERLVAQTEKSAELAPYDPSLLGAWLAEWLDDGWLRATSIEAVA